jgi:hypothetical protein
VSQAAGDVGIVVVRFGECGPQVDGGATGLFSLPRASDTVQAGGQGFLGAGVYSAAVVVGRGNGHVVFGDGQGLVLRAAAQAEFGIHAQGVAVGRRPAGVGGDQLLVGRQGKGDGGGGVMDAGEVGETLLQGHELNDQLPQPGVGGVLDEGGVGGQQFVDPGVVPVPGFARVVQEAAAVQPQRHELKEGLPGPFRGLDGLDGQREGFSVFLGVGQQVAGQLQGGHQRPGVRGGGSGRDAQQLHGLASGSHGIVEAIQACQGAGAQPVGVREIGQHPVAVRREVGHGGENGDGLIGGAEGLLGPVGLIEQHVGQTAAGDGYVRVERGGSGGAASRYARRRSCLIVKASPVSCTRR